MRAPAIRISLGVFDADKTETIAATLVETRDLLELGIRAMRGNLGYFFGVDRTANVMHNVSCWESMVDADQMGSYQPMLYRAGEFVRLGVRFQRPILNFETLWRF